MTKPGRKKIRCKKSMEYFFGRENIFREKILPAKKNPDTAHFFSIP